MVTSGAVTKRVDRLVQQGLVERTVSATDGRGRVVALTRKGKQVQERLHPQHLANEDQLLGALDADERRQLATSSASCCSASRTEPAPPPRARRERMSSSADRMGAEMPRR